MRSAILIIAHERPKYLYIALDALFKAEGIDDWDVWVYVDGGDIPRCKIQDVVDQFPIKGVHYRYKRFWVLHHVTFSIKSLIDKEYERILYLEEDFIIRPDTLQYVDSIKPENDVSFWSLQVEKQERVRIPCYYPLGNLVFSYQFESVFEYVVRAEYMNKIRPCFKDQIIDSPRKGHDMVYYRYLLDNDVNTQFAPIFYAGHFGIKGHHNRNNDETMLFHGEKEQWLSRAIYLIENADKYPNLPLLPKGWKYE